MLIKVEDVMKDVGKSIMLDIHAVALTMGARGRMLIVMNVVVVNLDGDLRSNSIAYLIDYITIKFGILDTNRSASPTRDFVICNFNVVTIPIWFLWIVLIIYKDAPFSTLVIIEVRTDDTDPQDARAITLVLLVKRG